LASLKRTKQSAESSWQNDMPHILMDKAEIKALFDNGEINRNDNIPNDAFLLQNQELSILKYALDIKNYRIGIDPENENIYVVVFKAPDQEKWTLISRFSNHAIAMKSLKNLINFIRKINIKSEGFYLMEHILIRPDLNSKVFGFKFIAKNGQILIEHSKWMTFHERDVLVESLHELLSKEAEINLEELSSFCKVNLNTQHSDLLETNSQDKNEQDYNKFFNYLKNCASQKEKFFTRFQMVVKGEDNLMINEDFFHLNMSVIFPSWPARFQDKNFREIAENLFRLNSPAHVNINFIWMGLSKMKRFEAWFFDWKKFTKEKIDSDTKDVLRSALVHLLYQ
jgi:hypothetical protein